MKAPNFKTDFLQIVISGNGVLEKWIDMGDEKIARDLKP